MKSEKSVKSELDVITSAEMAAIDTNCEYHGLSRLQLMENAGKALAEVILKKAEELKLGRSLLIFAGLGNNGGDSFVAARHLKNFEIKILLLGREGDIRTDIARRNFEILKNAGYNITEVRDSSQIERYDAEIVVDAMLGTGVKGRLREPFKAAVDAVNSMDSFVISVDVPTGLNPDTGEFDVCVKADATVTFHKNKPGLLKAREIVGEIIVKDIGIPRMYEMLVGPGDVQKVYRRIENAHKGMHGRVLVVGGGVYTGAPALSAMAALNAGVDIVTLAVPEEIYGVVATFSPNLIVRKLKGERISKKNIPEIERLLERHDVVVMGMGTGDPEFSDVAIEILKTGKARKAVLDAEAITSEIPEGVECILTPHGGEFRKVFGKNPDLENVRSMAERVGATILLKAREDIISDGIKVRINKTGNAGMTVGGTGDVLSGVVGALFASGDALWSASAAAFVSGTAGDICFKEMGFNFTALDVISKIPIAIKNSIEFGRT